MVSSPSGLFPSQQPGLTQARLAGHYPDEPVCRRGVHVPDFTDGRAGNRPYLCPRRTGRADFFRLLNFPDLTADGNFPLGGAVAVLIAGGHDPWRRGLAAIAGGCRWLTAWLNVRLGILQLLASILVMIALYSINLRIMGAPYRADRPAHGIHLHQHGK
jgi:hypothetical protein